MVAIDPVLGNHQLQTGVKEGSSPGRKDAVREC